MMINCPKCNLLQPKDRHCVQCGIDLKNWNPSKKPFWKEFIGHWIFQVGLLFSIIFLVVLKDSFKSQTDEDERRFTAQKQPRIQSKTRSFSGFSKTPLNTESKKYVKATNSPKNPTDLQKVKEKTTDEKKEAVESTVTPLKKAISFRISLMNNKIIENLMGNGQRLEDNALIIETQRLRQIITQQASKLKAMGYVNTYYQFNQEIPLFVGEEDMDTSSNIGFSLQITVFEESHSGGIHFGVQSWYQLKPDSSGPRKEWDVTMNNSSSLVIVHPEVHDISFSKEDVQFFSSSQNLSPLGDENSQENNDIVLILEIR